jgi:hypothetical protein
MGRFLFSGRKKFVEFKNTHMSMRKGEVTHSKEGSRSKEQALLEKRDD